MIITPVTSSPIWTPLGELAGPDQLHTQSDWQLSKWRPMSLSAVVWAIIEQILKLFILLILSECNAISGCYFGFQFGQYVSNLLLLEAVTRLMKDEKTADMVK